MTDINICVLGDGFVKGVGDEAGSGWVGRVHEVANKEHGPITFYNLGIDGNTSTEVLARVNELAPRMPVGADNRLILAFGVEDTALVDNKTRLSSQESVDSLKQLLIQTRSHYKMVMIGLHPVYDPQRNSRVRRLNGAYRELCTRARVPFIEIFTALADDVQYKRELAKGDKVHPGTQGYQKTFDLIVNDRVWWFS